MLFNGFYDGSQRTNYDRVSWYRKVSKQNNKNK